MKKLSIIAVAALFTLGLTSCKKDYTCTCTDSTGAKQVYDLGKQKKGDAKDACNTAGSLWILAGGTCSLD
jgi:hypothetical protein